MILVAVFQALCRIFPLIVDTLFKAGLTFMGIMLLWAIINEVMR